MRGTELRSNWIASQSVALRKWEDDTGTFLLNGVFDDRYFNLEGTGAVYKWNLKISQSATEALANGAASDVNLPKLDPDQE